MPNEPIFGELVKVELEACLSAPITRYFDAELQGDPDVLAQLLADKRNPNTRRAYEQAYRQLGIACWSFCTCSENKR
jgi:integrase/recombinase XerC